MQWHALLASNCDQDTPGPMSLTPNSLPLLHGDRKRPKHPNPDHQVIKELTLILESTLHETLTHSFLMKQGQSRSAITEIQREAQRDEHHNRSNEHRKISPKLNITNEEHTRVITPTMEIGTGEMNSTKQHSAADFVQNPTTTVGTVGTDSPLSAMNVRRRVIKQNIAMVSTAATTTTPAKVTPLITEGTPMKGRLISII